VGFATVTAGDVALFLIAHLPSMKRKTAQRIACALRSFLRFLHDQQIVEVALSQFHRLRTADSRVRPKH
jgi:hypothetical protein